MNNSKTITEWNELGFRILAGSKHKSRNAQGKCLFDRSQVVFVDDDEYYSQDDIIGYEDDF